MTGESSSAENQTINQRLLEQYNEIAQLAGSLAHEIKNPLSVIRMNMDLLAEELDPPQTTAERRALQKTKVVQEQCVRLQNLLDDFLRFARLRQLNLLPGSLNEQVSRVLDFVSAQAEKQGIEIVRYLDPDLPSINLDAETLYSALLNLVINAIQAMPDGGTLMVRTQETRHGVALGLIDTGCGMNEETALHMFDAFYSTKDGGSGLGLPLARKIIDAHQARIDVQSELGRGTKFTLEFPKPARISG
ncbi:two-component system sensor histidine kinase NtrB [Blastopirellula marina]|uniref:histidine kinase n=1 Tax=Blastopirellula marina TaxID=124 RepID=A0A2S8GES7_9BACT|nr:ATP-binding protein [Blastopirellula marina]PQO42956.1 ATPase [Blastopirellula marina]